MEYLVGSVTTIVTILVVLFVIKRINDSKPTPTKISYSQSNIYERIKPAIPYMPPKKKESQARNYKKSQMIKIAIIENNAYWITNSGVFTAPISEDGFVDYSAGIPIDTMTMDKVELDRLSFIVEKLTEGNSDDSSNTRH